MAHFTHNLPDPDVSSSPFLRLLDDVDKYSHQVPNGRPTRLLHWQLKFDVYETSIAYELRGELPSMKEGEVYIEFTEPRTIVIHYRTESTYNFDTPPADLHADNNMYGTITEDKEEQTLPKTTTENKRVSARLAKYTNGIGQQPVEHDKSFFTLRSVNDLSRSFSFPRGVDQDAVKTNIQNDILNIVIPKSQMYNH
ncbi:hypothetical protein BGZ63DRAFT_355264 [Mariannaea sp. PMI_226]|nr:hypothetical protein BGZ63DRAFT_355264 [Mariannaea sp. PMI_226]